MELSQPYIPGKKAIMPYYLVAAFSFVLVNILTLISVQDFNTHYFQPRILALTHLTVLGWITMIIMGACNQLVPVITNNKLHSDNIPVAAIILLISGTCILVCLFWNFQLGIGIYIGAFLILSALILHAMNIFISSKTTPKRNISADYILTAHAWLIVTALVGVTLLFNLRFYFLPAGNLHYLQIHASVGMAGWLLLLIIGVSSRLIPMFLLSRKEEKKYLVIAWYLINIGLLMFFIDGVLLHASNWYMLYILFIFSGLLFYLAFIWVCYTSAMRKIIDNGMKQSLIAISLISLPFIILILSVLYKNNAPENIITSYGYSFFAGFITILIMGQTFKTLPFIVWMHLAKPGMQLSLQPKDLFIEQLVLAQMILYVPGFFLFLTGILFKITSLMYVGSVIMIIASLLYFGHVIYVLKQLKRR